MSGVMSNVVVTGAGSGIGKEITKKFLRNGHSVVGLSREVSRKTEIKDKNFTPIDVDISKYKSVKKTFTEIRNIFDEIDILVNNAGIFVQKQFDKCSLYDIDSIIDTNLKGAMYCTHQALKQMKTGNIINIGSVAALHGIKNQVIYCASKYGLNGFSEALGQEVKGKNIFVTTVFLGGTNTPLWSSKNPYRGNKSKILQGNQVAEIVYEITLKKSNMIVKNLTVFPSNEWH